MFKRLFLLLLVLALIFVAAGSAAAKAPAAQQAEPTWTAQFWNNTGLSGTPAHTRQDQVLSFDWGTGSPQPGVINPDFFSARWSRVLEFSGGTYTFSATSDDGIRVYIDGALIIGDWESHAERTISVDRNLTPGAHKLIVEYWENGGDAVAKLNWSGGPPTIFTNWRGEYFNNTSLSGLPILVHENAQLFFNWGFGSPAAGLVNADYFSARWTKTVNFAPGNYTFSATVDDGVRLWVNGQLIIDKWTVQAAATHSASIYLSGDAQIKMEYFEQTGLAAAQLTWSQGAPQLPPAPVPGNSVIVDNSSLGFVTGGIASSWRMVNEGYNNSLHWTKNNDELRAGYNWGRWYPSLAAGLYEVYVYIPERYTTTSAARYWISHRDGYTLRVVSQSANGDRWVSLGIYHFQGNNSDYVSLSDITFEPYLSRLIAWDAMRWDPR